MLNRIALIAVVCIIGLSAPALALQNLHVEEAEESVDTAELVDGDIDETALDDTLSSGRSASTSSSAGGLSGAETNDSNGSNRSAPKSANSTALDAMDLPPELAAILSSRPSIRKSGQTVSNRADTTTPNGTDDSVQILEDVSTLALVPISVLTADSNLSQLALGVPAVHLDGFVREDVNEPVVNVNMSANKFDDRIPGAYSAPNHSAESASNGSAAGDGQSSSTAGVSESADSVGSSVGLALILVGCFGRTPVTVARLTVFSPGGRHVAAESLQHAFGEFFGGSGWRWLPAIFLSSYSRTDDSDPLENQTRAAIYETVTKTPGVYYAKLASKMGITEETVRYHSRILASEGLVEIQKIRGRQRLYPVSITNEDLRLAAALADSAAADVLGEINSQEPTTCTALADDLGCALSTIAHHIDRLEEDGLVVRKRDGSAVTIQLRQRTRSALATVSSD